MNKELLGKVILTAWMLGIFGFFIATATDRTQYIIAITPVMIFVLYAFFRTPRK